MKEKSRWNHINEGNQISESLLSSSHHKKFNTIKYNNKKEYINELWTNTTNTLPFTVIKEIHIHNCMMSFEELLNSIIWVYDKLRKPDGSKYGKDISKVLKATLHTSGLFCRLTKTSKLKYKDKEKDIDIDKYDWNEDNVIKYLERHKSKKNNDTEFLGNKRNSQEAELSITHNKTTKARIWHAYNIMSELLSKYSLDNKINKQITNPFNKCGSSWDLIVKIGDSEKLIGMLTCFKIFKPTLHKALIKNKKYDKKKLSQMNTKITDLKQGIDFIHQMWEL